MLYSRLCFIFAIFSTTWNLNNCGFVNEPCNERNTLYITSEFEKITNRTQCLDISGIDINFTKNRNFLEIYDKKFTRNIKTIYAESIGLKAVPKLEKFYNLEELFLPDNKIRTLPIRAFKRNSKLRLLVLNKNNIRGRRNKPLIKSASINILILSINKISHVDKYTFYNLPNMHTLYLDNNHIQHLPYDTFRNQLNLKYLRITRNPLKFLSILLPPNVQLHSDTPNKFSIE